MDYPSLYYCLKGYANKIDFDFEEVLEAFESEEDAEEFREEIYEYCAMKKRKRNSLAPENIPKFYDIFTGKNIDEVKTMHMWVLQQLTYDYLVLKNYKMKYVDSRHEQKHT